MSSLLRQARVLVFLLIFLTDEMGHFYVPEDLPICLIFFTLQSCLLFSCIHSLNKLQSVCLMFNVNTLLLSFACPIKKLKLWLLLPSLLQGCVAELNVERGIPSVDLLCKFQVGYQEKCLYGKGSGALGQAARVGGCVTVPGGLQEMWRRRSCSMGQWWAQCEVKGWTG